MEEPQLAPRRVLFRRADGFHQLHTWAGTWRRSILRAVDTRTLALARLKRSQSSLLVALVLALAMPLALDSDIATLAYRHRAITPLVALQGTVRRADPWHIGVRRAWLRYRRASAFCSSAHHHAQKPVRERLRDDVPSAEGAMPFLIEDSPPAGATNPSRFSTARAAVRCDSNASTNSPHPQGRFKRRPSFATATPASARRFIPATCDGSTGATDSPAIKRA